MKNISKKIAALLVVPAVVVSMGLAATPVGAETTPAPDSGASASIKNGINAVGGTGQKDLNIPSILKEVVNWLLYAVGVVAVIMLIWGGIKYATSAGDTNKVTSAKNTILYAVIGLGVAVLAFAIVNLVVNSLQGGTLKAPAATEVPD